MSNYSKLGKLYDSQRLGSFEGQGVSNTFGNQFGNHFGELGQISRPSWSPISSIPQGAIETCVETSFPRLRDDQLITCYSDLEAVQCRDARNQPCSVSFATELRARGYDLQGGRWEKRTQEEGTSAGEVLTGIAAILNPLATAGVGIFQAQQQAKLQKLQLKQGGGGGNQNAALIAALQRQNQGGSNTGVIIAVVLVVVVMGMMMFMMSKKK